MTNLINICLDFLDSIFMAFRTIDFLGRWFMIREFLSPRGKQFLEEGRGILLFLAFFEFRYTGIQEISLLIACPCVVSHGRGGRWTRSGLGWQLAAYVGKVEPKCNRLNATDFFDFLIRLAIGRLHWESGAQAQLPERNWFVWFFDVKPLTFMRFSACCSFN